MKTLKLVCIGLALAVAPFARAAEPKADCQNIVEVAKAAGSFNTLLTAVQDAGLVDTLANTQNLTVFAPTDAAFAKIPADVLNKLLADQDALKNVLLYHVIGAEVPAATAETLTSATMLNGKKVTIKVVNGSLFINDAKVIMVDVQASNGIIHVIDTVLIP